MRYSNLKDADTFYTKVTAREIIAFLDANSGGLHAVNMISLCTNMHNYYTQADGIPQYINMLEDAQKKAMRAGMPIAVMMASAAVLRPNTSRVRLTTGKASPPPLAPGRHGKWPSALRT